jgi:hypothetical protein
MAQWVEINGSRSATIHRIGKRADSTYTKTYRVFGVDDDMQLHSEANNKFSADRFVQIGAYQLMVESYTVQHIAERVYEVAVTYVKAGSDDESPMRRTRSFDTTGGQSHMTQAYSERKYPEADAPSMMKAICVADESVKGIDVIVPALQWTEAYDVPAAYVTDAYIKTVASLTGTVNKLAFRSFDVGEVLFAGCNGTQEWDSEKGDGPWNLSYKFVASPNAGEGKTLPPVDIDGITGPIEKRGHEYLWIKYQASEDKNVIVQKPQFVYVNRVYREGDFAGLGIGVA